MAEEKAETAPETAKKKSEPPVEEFTVIAAGERADNPDAKKVRLQRVGDEPVTTVTIEYKGEFLYWRPDAKQTVFDVDAITARAAVGTGGFAVHPDSKVKLKQ